MGLIQAAEEGKRLQLGLALGWVTSASTGLVCWRAGLGRLGRRSPDGPHGFYWPGPLVATGPEGRSCSSGTQRKAPSSSGSILALGRWSWPLVAERVGHGVHARPCGDCVCERRVRGASVGVEPRCCVDRVAVIGVRWWRGKVLQVRALGPNGVHGQGKLLPMAGAIAEPTNL